MNVPRYQFDQARFLAAIASHGDNLTQADILICLSRATVGNGDFAQVIADAREETTDEVEIDNEPLVSPTPDDDGCWVSAWVWVPYRAE